MERHKGKRERPQICSRRKNLDRETSAPANADKETKLEGILEQSKQKKSGTVKYKKTLYGSLFISTRRCPLAKRLAAMLG